MAETAPKYLASFLKPSRPPAQLELAWPVFHRCTTPSSCYSLPSSPYLSCLSKISEHATPPFSDF